MKTSVGTVLVTVDTSLATKINQVKTSIANDDLQALLIKANGLDVETLVAAWSDPMSRSYDSQGRAISDGSPYNDISPSVSLWLNNIMGQYGFKQITVTDARGYVVAATSATTQFDYCPNDYNLLKDPQGGMSLVKCGTGGVGAQWWYRAKNSGDRYYVTPYSYNDTTMMYVWRSARPSTQAREP